MRAGAIGTCLQGDWQQGARTGTGTYVWANGTRYEGAFLDNRLHGEGTIHYADDQTRSGLWTRGQLTEERPAAAPASG